MPKNANEITYRAYRSASLRRRLNHLIWQKKSIYAYLDGVYSNSGGLDAFGFNFMYGQAIRFPEVSDWCGELNVRVVHLIRENCLKVLVSRQVAKSRGIYYSTSPLGRTAVTLDVDTLEAALRKMEGDVERYRQTFSTLPYTEVYYEKLVAHRDSEFRGILEFLGADPDETLTTDVVKTSPDSLSTLIENYDEVCESLAGTPYERFLD